MSAFDLKDKGSENASGSLCVNLTSVPSTGWKQIEIDGANGTNGNKCEQMEEMETKTKD